MLGLNLMADISNDHLQRLAVYGTLAPGRPNHEQLEHLEGRWYVGIVRGHLHDSGWGAALGFPGLVHDESGDEILVHIFESETLAAEWQRLDAFEGPGYRRVSVNALTDSGSVLTNIYVLASE